MDATNDMTGVDTAVIASIADKLFQVMPLLRKRMLRLDGMQAEYGIPLSHVQVLAMLEEPGSMSVSEISRRFGIAKPNITPLVDTRSWIARCPPFFACWGNCSFLQEFFATG